MRQKIRIMFYLCIFVALVLVLVFPPDYYFVYKYLTGIWNEDAVLETKPVAPYLHENTRVFYRAVSVGEQDIEQGIVLLRKLLLEDLRKKRQEKVLYLLGEFYFISKRYTESLDFFWRLLKLDPKNKVYRQNYEFVQILSQIVHAGTEERVNTELQNKNGISEEEIQSLEPVQESSLYFIHIKDTEEKSDLPQW